MIQKPVIPFRILNLFIFILAAIIHILCAVLPNNPSSMTMGPLTPAYSIWGLIYLLQLTFIVYQVFPWTFRLKYINQAITPMYPIQSLAQVGYLLSQKYAQASLAWLKLLFLVILLISLVAMYLGTRWISREDVRKGEGSARHYYTNYFLGRIWISIYLPWILYLTGIESFLNLSPLKTSAPPAIAFALLGLLTLLILALFRDTAFGFGTIWASLWLALNRPPNPIFLSAIITGGFVFTLTSYTFGSNLHKSYAHHKDQQKHRHHHKKVILANDDLI